MSSAACGHREPAPHDLRPLRDVALKFGTFALRLGFKHFEPSAPAPALFIEGSVTFREFGAYEELLAAQPPEDLG